MPAVVRCSVGKFITTEPRYIYFTTENMSARGWSAARLCTLFSLLAAVAAASLMTAQRSLRRYITQPQQQQHRYRLGKLQVCLPCIISSLLDRAVPSTRVALACSSSKSSRFIFELEYSIIFFFTKKTLISTPFTSKQLRFIYNNV